MFNGAALLVGNGGLAQEAPLANTPLPVAVDVEAAMDALPVAMDALPVAEDLPLPVANDVPSPVAEEAPIMPVQDAVEEKGALRVQAQ